MEIYLKQQFAVFRLPVHESQILRDNLVKQESSQRRLYDSLFHSFVCQSLFHSYFNT